LDDLGLTAAIEWGAREFQKRTGIQHQFSSNKEEFDLTKDCATAVFRIFQETLTNVTRHARATKINVNLEENAGSLLLEVRDDGRGITEKEISNPKSMGLLGMRERALLFGGEIKIRGAPGKGTTVRLEIPLKKPMNGKKEGRRPGRMRRRE
jgi:signal transduction histidine kinase